MGRIGYLLIALITMTIITVVAFFVSGCPRPSKPRERIAKPSTTTTTVQRAKKITPKTAFPEAIAGLDQPIAMAFAPDRRIFITERVGRIRIFADNRLERKPFATVNVPQLTGYNETGLLGIALHPDYAAQPFVYVYHTYSRGGRLFNRVVRFKESRENTMTPQAEVIIDKIPAGRIHDGGILAFGPDGNLYISTGESGNSSLAQDLTSTAGKILRLKPDGKIPSDNPFKNSPVYSYGHRNVFGMAFDPITGALYITENGPDVNDEVNKIEKGKNYGWPIVTGKTNDKRFVNPLITYTPNIAPTQAIFYTGNIFPAIKDRFVFGTFNTGDLHALELTGTARDIVQQDKIVFRSTQSIIGVVQSPDGDIYIIEPNMIRKLEGKL